MLQSSVTTPVLTLTASSQSSTYGQALTFTISVTAGSPGTGTPTGVVQFLDGSTVLDTQLLDKSGLSVSRPVTSLGASVHAITAVYLGDARFTGLTSQATAVNVARAMLSVAAGDLTKVYGLANPIPSWSFTGFVNGDQPSTSGIVGSPSVTMPFATSHVGAYPIVIGPGTLSAANYDFPADRMRNGTLSVTPAPLTITANNQSMVQGGTVPQLTVLYDGFVNGDSASSLNAAVQLGTPATSSSPSGEYPITPSRAGSTDYTITYHSGILTVTPASSSPSSYSGYGLGRDGFVTVLFREVLGRDPRFDELTTWSRRLAQGTNPSRVATSLWSSPEHRRLVKQKGDPKIPLRRAYNDAMAAGRKAVRVGNVVPAGPMVHRSIRTRK